MPGSRQGDVVIAAGGALVGRVTDVGPELRDRDPDQRPVLDGDRPDRDERGQGQVIGQLGGALIMQNIDSTEKVQPGEQVADAGDRDAGRDPLAYPKGLLIGEITDVRKDPNSVVQTAYLLPTTDLDKLAYVLVILDYVGGLPGAGRHADRLRPDRARRRPAGRRAAMHRAERGSHADPSATVTA